MIKVGDNVKIIKAAIDTNLIGKIEKVIRVKGNEFWTEHSTASWTITEISSYKKTTTLKNLISDKK